MNTTPRKQLRVSAVETKTLEITLRKAAGLTISQTDETFLAAHVNTLNSMWSQVSALNNYFVAAESEQEHTDAFQINADALITGGCLRHLDRSVATCFDCFRVGKEREKVVPQ